MQYKTDSVKSEVNESLRYLLARNNNDDDDNSYNSRHKLVTANLTTMKRNTHKVNPKTNGFWRRIKRQKPNAKNLNVSTIWTMISIRIPTSSKICRKLT